MVDGKKINNSRERLTVLIAPLNWGLGHVTRCIPIIRILQKLNCDPILAADNDGILLLRKEFPNVIILPLSASRIRYSRNKESLIFKIALQLPKLIINISKEKRWLKNIINIYEPDVIISDNRPGMYNKDIISIYITHQLAIKTGNFFLDKIATKIHNWFIKKYDQCWVPDSKEDGLAGDLSHPKKLQANTIYLGALSRFENLAVSAKIYDLLISISGPEPQRTIFENMIFDQLKNYKKKALVVRGLPADNKKIKSLNSFVEIINHLPAADLNIAFLQSDMIICRSGYSTIMDLVKINKQAILVPTPGQAEQEYLAEYLMKNKKFFSVKQTDFLLEDALSKAADFPFEKRNDSMENYKEIIAEFVRSVKAGNFENR